MLRSLLITSFLAVTMTLSGQQATDIFVLDGQDLVSKSDSSDITLVSASRNAKLRGDLPVTVYIVTRQDILENGYTSLTDVLKHVPGIKVSQPGSGIEGDFFLLSGIPGNYYCKILVNNNPVSPSGVSGMPIAEQLPIRQAERIEIIFGPASALYGSDALAGIINIITHTSERPVWAQSDVSLGSSGYYNLNVMIGGKVGKSKNILSYDFFGSYGQMGDMKVIYDLENNYNPSQYKGLALVDTVGYFHQPFYRGDSLIPDFDKLQQHSNLIGFGFNYRGLSFQFLHLYRNTHSSIGLSPDLYTYYNPRNFWGETIDRYLFSYTKSGLKVTSTTSASYLLYRLDPLSNFGLVTERGNQGTVYYYAASDDLLFEEILNLTPAHNLEITGGITFQYSGNLPRTNDLDNPFDEPAYKPFSEAVKSIENKEDSFGYNPQNFYNAGAFLQLFYSIADLNIQVGGRWDEHSIFGGQFNPRIGLLYRFSDKWSAHVNYGTGFRAPSLYYVYYSVAYPKYDGVLYENLPYNNLEPERFRAVEFAVRSQPSNRFITELILTYHKFNNNISNSLIWIDTIRYPDPINENQLAFAFVNDQQSQAELFLAQLRLQANTLFEPINLNADLFLNFSKGREILPNNLGTINSYRNMPGFFCQLNLDFRPVKVWTIYFNNIWSAKATKRFLPFSPDVMEKNGFPVSVPGYYTLDITNRFRINRNFQAFVLICNIFNAHYGGMDASSGYYNLNYNPQYGRNFRVGFNFSIE